MPSSAARWARGPAGILAPGLDRRGRYNCDVGQHQLRAEYRHSDYGTVRDNLLNSSGGAINAHQRGIDNRAQVGFSYKFDSLSHATPVVVSY